jgi:hypothetical protein
MAKVINSETSYLDGPNARGDEFWFSLKVLMQLLRGFRKLHFSGPCISVFGSARFEENHPDYQLARLVGKEIAKMGFTTLTGGGPGIMEAANRGAFENNGTSIGCTIKLPHEQSNNPYLHKVIPFLSLISRRQQYTINYMANCNLIYTFHWFIFSELSTYGYFKNKLLNNNYQ